MYEPVSTNYNSSIPTDGNKHPAGYTPVATEKTNSPALHSVAPTRTYLEERNTSKIDTNAAVFLAPGSHITVNENRTIRTFDCANGDARIAASNCQITLRGRYSSVTVHGKNNRVTVASPRSIKVEGDDNHVFWTDTNCIPSISGSNNTVRRKKSDLD